MRKPTPPQPARESRPATSAEIGQAIEALTHEDNERIERTALNRIARIWRAANGRSHLDLIQEAFTRILDGKRNWHKDRVTFPKCLIGVIRSIASEWAGHRKRNKDLPEYAALESDLLKTDDEGKTKSPFDGVRNEALNAEEELVETAVTAEQEAEHKIPGRQDRSSVRR
jgi:hypothetical protein